MDNAKNRTPSSVGSLLIAPGKSSRLREMRDKVLAAKASEPITPLQNKTTECDPDVSPELTLVRQLIDQRLAKILASLPAGKQRSLFRIRFGVEFDEIKNLPIKRVVVMLKIRHPQLDSPHGNMKQTLELTYNG